MLETIKDGYESETAAELRRINTALEKHEQIVFQLRLRKHEMLGTMHLGGVMARKDILDTILDDVAKAA